MEKMKIIASAFQGTKKPVAIFCDLEIIEKMKKELDVPDSLKAKFENISELNHFNHFGAIIDGVELFFIDESQAKDFIDTNITAEETESSNGFIRLNNSHGTSFQVNIDHIVRFNSYNVWVSDGVGPIGVKQCESEIVMLIEKAMK
jgi:hypothetical protein